MSEQPTPEGTVAATPPEPTDDVVVTHHTFGRGRNKINYTATTGRVVLREEVITDGKFEGSKARAEIFHTAYTLDDAAPGTRPVTFAFNGGPGSSSVWLHLGLFGPRRVIMGDAGELADPPYELADNLESLLAVSDLVFIDPVTTGFSRSASGHTSDDFHGYTRDVESVGEFIRLWTTRHGRWMSPKFLAGESYGTTRAAALASYLSSAYGLYLNGIMLISSVLDMGSVHFSEGNDLPYQLFFPTYVTTAHYHGKVRGSLQNKLKAAEDFAGDELGRALRLGHRMPASERAEVVKTYAALTGLDEAYVDRADLRIDLFEFCAELLRDRGLVVGRLDTRFTGPAEKGNAARMGYDPSHSAINGPYAATLNHYVRAELGYESDLVYQILTAKVHPWSYKEFEGRAVEVASELATAMRHNPHLRVHVACGLYDGATPHFAAEHVFAHLKLPRADADRIEWKYYEAGHMMYVHEESRVAQLADLAEFVTRGTAAE
ncbi:S10 family peptidase [Propionibacteriaceae bacterium Y1685]